MKDGAELALTTDYVPGGAPAQQQLVDQEGDNDGVNVRLTVIGAVETKEWTFNVLVVTVAIQPASSGDTEAKEMVTFNLRINSDVTLVTTPTAGP